MRQSQAGAGVFDRILSIADRGQPLVPDHRPPYHYQVPLEFIPGLGPAKMNALLAAFGTEMNILHGAGEAEIAAVAGTELAAQIVLARTGNLHCRLVAEGRTAK